MARKVPDDVQKVFDKYIVNFVRRLNKDKAIEMFQQEFDLNEERSEIMFQMFDKDRNNILSAWEFYLFYKSFGYNANKYLDLFNDLSKNGECIVEVEEMWNFLTELETLTGHTLEDKALEQMIKGVAGDDRSVDRKKFIDLICRIKLTRH